MWGQLTSGSRPCDHEMGQLTSLLVLSKMQQISLPMMQTVGLKRLECHTVNGIAPRNVIQVKSDQSTRDHIRQISGFHQA